MAITEPTKKPTTAVFKYLEWQNIYNHEKPYQILIEIPEEAPEQRQSNLVFHDGPPQQVHDVRGREREFTLDKNGFQYVSHTSKLSGVAFDSQDTVESIYFGECEHILRKHLDDVTDVAFFDWRVRGTEIFDDDGKEVNLRDPTDRLPPARFAHVDQAPEGVLSRLKDHFGDRMEIMIACRRLRVVNIWRPIGGPVRNWPLAVCDSTTLDPLKLVRTDQVRRNFTGTSLYAMYDENMQWYFLNGQKEDEVLLLKQFDSADVDAKNCAHSAFMQYDDVPNSLGRQSVEIRAFVFSR